MTTDLDEMVKRCTYWRNLARDNDERATILRSALVITEFHLRQIAKDGKPTENCLEAADMAHDALTRAT